MTAAEARNRRVCRVCEQPISSPITLNYGEEFAHTSCLSDSPPRPDLTPDGTAASLVDEVERLTELIIGATYWPYGAAKQHRALCDLAAAVRLVARAVEEVRKG